VANRVTDLLAGAIPPPVWEWTDDTEMACSITWMLREATEADQDLDNWCAVLSNFGRSGPSSVDSSQ
jgi:ADP-ribosylglycohydrolase